MLLPPPPAVHAPSRTARQSNTIADGYGTILPHRPTRSDRHLHHSRRTPPRLRLQRRRVVRSRGLRRRRRRLRRHVRQSRRRRRGRRHIDAAAPRGRDGSRSTPTPPLQSPHRPNPRGRTPLIRETPVDRSVQVTVCRSPSSKTAENYTRRTRRLRTWRRGGGGEAMTDAAVDEVERDGVKTGHNNQPLVWKGWWDSHLYAGRCKNVYILQIKMCGLKRHNNKNV